MRVHRQREGVREPPSAKAVELLREVAARKIHGVLPLTPERDRLRRLGYIEGFTPAHRTAGAPKCWRATLAGEEYLASLADA